jgi:HK97 family phage major capsid protein
MKSLAELAEVDKGQRAAEFSCLLRHLALGRGDWSTALAMASEQRLPERVRTVLEKAAVSGGDFSNWGSGLDGGYSTLVAGFTDSLKWSSAFYRLLADGALIRLPFRVRVGAIGTAAGAAVISPGAAIPISWMQLEGTTLDERKAAALCVLTEELLRAAGPASESLISRSLRATVGQAVDAEFVSIITEGVAPITGTTAPYDDLAALFGAIDYGADSRLYFLAAPDTALNIATATAEQRLFPEAGVLGGSVLGLPLLVSDGVPLGTLILLDASSIAGNAGDMQVNASRHSALEMSDAPLSNIGTLGSPGAPVGSNAVSLFQTNSVAIRCIASFGAAVIRAGSIAVLDGINW